MWCSQFAWRMGLPRLPLFGPFARPPAAPRRPPAVPAPWPLGITPAGQRQPRGIPHRRQRGGAQNCQGEGPAVSAVPQRTSLVAAAAAVAPLRRLPSMRPRGGALPAAHLICTHSCWLLLVMAFVSHIRLLLATCNQSHKPLRMVDRARPSRPPAAQRRGRQLLCRHRELQVSNQLPHGDGIRVWMAERKICRRGGRKGASVGASAALTGRRVWACTDFPSRTQQGHIVQRAAPRKRSTSRWLSPARRKKECTNSGMGARFPWYAARKLAFRISNADALAACSMPTARSRGEGRHQGLRRAAKKWGDGMRGGGDHRAAQPGWHSTHSMPSMRSTHRT